MDLLSYMEIKSKYLNIISTEGGHVMHGLKVSEAEFRKKKSGYFRFDIVLCGSHENFL